MQAADESLLYYKMFLASQESHSVSGAQDPLAVKEAP